MSTLTDDPHKLAADGLVHYCGDVNPLDHDGYWYDASQWEANGYASAVEVICLPDGPDGGKHVLVSLLTINKPSTRFEGRMLDAFNCCGVDPLSDDAKSAACQIECVKSYMGGEPDCSDWREPSTYGFIIPDDMDAYMDEEDAAHDGFSEYARIHNAEVCGEETVWELLARLVGRDLHKA